MNCMHYVVLRQLRIEFICALICRASSHRHSLCTAIEGGRRSEQQDSTAIFGPCAPHRPYFVYSVACVAAALAICLLSTNNRRPEHTHTQTRTAASAFDCRPTTPQHPTSTDQSVCRSCRVGSRPPRIHHVWRCWPFVCIIKE